MSGLSQEQVENRASIQKGATVWGVIAGVIAGLLALWILSGQGGAVRFGGAGVIGLVVGVLTGRASFKSGAKSALCDSCGAAFSRSRTDRAETLASSEAKEEREEQEDKSTKVTTWTEETFDVVDTYTCAKCGNATTKAYQSKRRRDEESVIEPFEEPQKKAGGGKSKSTAAQNAKPDAEGKKGRAGNK